MGKKIVFIAGIVGLFLAAGIGRVFAQEQAGGTGNIKQEISQDKQQLGEQKQAISEHAQAARTEEGQLREQVHQAMQSGNMEQVKELRDELKATHRENIQEKQADMQALRENRKDLKQDMKAAEGRRPLPFNVGKGVRKIQAMGREGPPPPDYQAPPTQSQPGSQAPTAPPATKKEASLRDRMEDRRDKREDVRDRREDIRDRREDIRDEQHQGGLRDKLEDIRDRREDTRDRREDRRDLREDRRDMREGQSGGGANSARGTRGGGKGGQRGGGGGRPQQKR